MRTFLDAIRAALARATALPEAEIKLEAPRDPALGDLAFPCFALAKAAKKSPPAVASELQAAVAGRIAGVEAVATGPYVNFRIDRALLARAVIGDVLAHGEAYGTSG